MNLDKPPINNRFKERSPTHSYVTHFKLNQKKNSEKGYSVLTEALKNQNFNQLELI